MAKPSKKMKVTNTAEDLNEPEKQSTETSLQVAEATVDEPPREEHNVTMDATDVNPSNSK